MNCKDAQLLINAYIDKELDAANVLSLEQHVGQCQDCSRSLAEYNELSKRIRQSHLSRPAPEQLKVYVSGLSDEAMQVKSTPVLRHSLIIKYTSIAATLLVVIAASLLIHTQHLESKMIADVLSGHTKAINAGRTIDITASKPEQLKNWFTSRLDYSPKVPNLSENGLTLQGGRLDALQNQKIAVISYLYKNQILNLYTWPSVDVDDAEVESHIHNGYRLVYWCKDKMNYWIVSDMNKTDMSQLEKQIRQQLDPDPR